MKLPLPEYVWFDGKYVPTAEAQVPITTHAIHYGTSVFEGIRAYWNGENLHVFRLPEHVARFRKSGQYYDMELRFTDQEVSDAITGTCKKNDVRAACYIRPFYFVGEYGISLYVKPEAPTRVAVITFLLGDMFDKGGITASMSSWRKFSARATPTQAKMGGNYLNSIIATQEAKKKGVDEGIMLDYDGRVSEAPGENVFIVSGGKLHTPTAESSPLEGITRNTVIEVAKEAGIETVERDIAKEELFSADEIFLTGTAAEIIPVISLESQKIGGGKPGGVTARMMKEYDDIVMDRNPRYSHWLTAVY